MNKYLSRVTSSARGEVFNPLIYPFLFSTLVFGIGFAIVQPIFGTLGANSLYTALIVFGSFVPVVWGIIALITIVGGATFLLFNIPPFGKVSGLIGFMLWAFAGMSYFLTGAWLSLLAIAVPNMVFWIWQYLSLSLFRREDAWDKRTMQRYDAGEYDNQQDAVEGKRDRLDNRGQDLQ